MNEPEFTQTKITVAEKPAPPKPATTNKTVENKVLSWTTVRVFGHIDEAKAFRAKHYPTAVRTGGGGRLEFKIHRQGGQYALKVRDLAGAAIPKAKA